MILKLTTSNSLLFSKSSFFQKKVFFSVFTKKVIIFLTKIQCQKISNLWYFKSHWKKIRNKNLKN